jgi:myotubularin-related protein 5/13
MNDSNKPICIILRFFLLHRTDKQQELINSEESTIYSQAIHYAYRMVYLLVPLEAGRRQDQPRHHDDERISNSITNSAGESDSADAESGFEEAETGDIGVNVIKMVSRFVDKVRFVLGT